MIRLDAATVLLQWAAGGLLFTWFTTRRREVGIGYGWLMRGTYGLMAVAAFVIGLRYGRIPVREVSSVLVAIGAFAGLGSSIARRRAGVSGQQEEHDRRTARIAAQTGIERDPAPVRADDAGPEFDPRWDLLGPLLALPGLVAAGLDAGGDGGHDVVAIARLLVGAAFLGAITDAMLLGHWYLVQPGLPRKLLNELVGSLVWIWPFEVAVMLLPTGMISAIKGTVDDGWNGTLAWMWVACSIGTIALVKVTQMALKERYYSAVMSATGLLYLAILTAFGQDLVARAVLS